VPGDDWKPTVPERPSSRDPKTVTDAPSETPRPQHPPQRYIGGEEIARGGMGRVIEATDTVLARTVAVKEALTNDPETLRRFARETRITARLEHPSIVPVYDAGTDPAAPFYVMRRVSGRPLSGLITAAESLDERLALIPHVLACAQAIAHAHKRGVLHRDIKPNNILVGELGETVVIDWGIAKVIGESDGDDHLPPMAGDSLRTRIGTVSGTPGFMSPEQSRGDEIGPSADVWALGATLYYLLSRQLPHAVNAKTPDDLLAYAAHRPVPPIASVIAGVPPELAAITERALAFDVADRFPDAASFAEELSRFLTGQIVASHRYSVRERFVRWMKRNRAIVAVAVLAIAVVATVSTIAIRRVIAARERADEARQQAEIARAKEQAHAQSELLARARAIATTHPTAAIAALDQLPAGSPLLGEADAIFATALSHGGAVWGLAQNSGMIGVLEMDPTATKLLQLSHKGRLQVWDLESRKLIVEETIVRGDAYPEWIAGGVLLYGHGPTKLLDIAKGTIEPFGTSSGLKNIIASEDGTRVAIHDHAGRAGWLDTTTGDARFLTDQAAPVVAIAMPRDGSWVAAASKDEIRVYDPAGAIILRRRAKAAWLTASRSKRLAYLEGDSIFEAELGPAATWVERASFSVMWPDYLDEMLVGRSPSTLYAFAIDPKKPPFAISKISGVASNMYAAGSGMVTFTTGTNSSDLLYFDSVRTLRIPMPEALVSPRVTARPQKRRIAVAGNSGVFVIDLGYMLPHRRDDIRGSKAQFITRDHVVEIEAGGTWVIVSNGDRATLKHVQPYSEIMDISRGRVLFADFPLRPSRLFIADVAKMKGFAIDASLGALLHDGIIYVAEGTLYVRTDGDTVPREIGKLSGDESSIFVEKNAFWAISNNELLRGDLVSGLLERKPFPFPKEATAAAIDGRLLVGHGKELRWDSLDGPLLATVEETIALTYPVRGGAVVTLSSQATMYVGFGPDNTATVHHLSSTTLTVTNEAGRLVVPSPNGTEVIELPSRRRWIHAITNPMPRHLSVPPDGGAMLELGVNRTWWEWSFPPANLAVSTLRPSATNAREQDDRTLLWPWQTGR
jgi:hypothetical protein